MHIEEPDTRNFLEVEALQRQLQAQTTLKNSQQLLISLKIALLNTGLGLWEWNLVSSQFDFDSASQQILGYKPDEIINRQSFEQLIHPHDISRVIQARHKYLELEHLDENELDQENGISSYEVEFRILSRSGWKWIIERAVAIIDHSHNSHARSILGIHQDITAQKSLESVQQSQARSLLLQRVLSFLDSCDSLEKLEITLQTIVDEVRHFLGTRAIVIYRYDNNSTNVSTSTPTDNNNYTSFAVPIFIRHLDSDGAFTKDRILWGILAAFFCSNMTWKQSQIDTLKLIAIVIGVAIGQANVLHHLQTVNRARQVVEAQANERLAQIDHQSLYLVQIQKQLLKKQKIAILGELIVGLVKEIYNPVEFIFNALHSASQHGEDLIQLLEYYQHRVDPNQLPPKLHLDINFVKTDFIKLLWSLRASSQRLQQTVVALHNFSHDDAQTKKTDLNAALDGAITILQHRLKQQSDQPGIEVVKQFGDIPLVQCLPGELNQVFIFLLINAIEALEERMKYDHSFMPQILISTEIVHSHLSLIGSNRTDDRQKHKVLIHIYDNGKGILPHIQRRIFEPFFTTKPIAKGAGLGLAISRQIIEENHRGQLRCNSQLGHGTEFIIEISAKDRHYTDIKKQASFLMDKNF
jgi:two-component system, NtrC family, sensor kinase